MFGYFKVLFCVYGVNYTQIHSKWFKRLVFALLIQLVAYATFALGQKSYEYFEYHKSYTIVYLFSYILYFFYLLHLTIFKMKINEFNDIIEDLLKEDDKHLINRYSRVFSFIFITLLLIDMCLSHNVLLIDDIDVYVKSKLYLDSKTLNPIVKYVIIIWRYLCILLTSNFLYLMIFIYVSYILLISKISHSFIANFREYIKNNSLKCMRIYWRKICYVRCRFERLFTWYPLLTFAYTYLKTILFLIYFKSQTFKFDYKMTTSLYYLSISIVIPIVLVCFIDHANSESRQLVEQLVSESLIDDDLADCEQLLNEINQNYKMKFTAYGLFTLDKRLLVGFTSALISFSILFMQLSA